MNTQHFNNKKPTLIYRAAILYLIVHLWGCSPRVAVELPDKPITINLNVKIDHEVRVKVEKDLDAVISDNSKLF